MAKSRNILYSTNSVLAYRISEQYYGGLHYVWCSTVFGSLGLGTLLCSNPASSTPYERYRRLQQEVGPPADLHSTMIAAQRVGIKFGATAKYKAGKITADERDEVIQIVDEAEASDFVPLMYVMPYQKVKNLVKRVPLSTRAHPLSDEWVIEELPTGHFDILRY